MTCSALTAGVMALGLALGEIENSHTRVARMIATMAVRGDAFADDLNAFNRLMNLGHELSLSFEAEFGSTQCRALTRSDFASTADVHEYIDRDGTADCVRLARPSPSTSQRWSSAPQWPRTTTRPAQPDDRDTSSTAAETSEPSGVGTWCRPMAR
jgi:hypothetical protein